MGTFRGHFFQITVFVSELVENIVEKGENAGYQHFLRFPQCFQMPSHHPKFAE